MGKIVISTNATLDGVIQDPDGAEHFARGGWFSPAGSNDREAWAKVETAEAMRTEAHFCSDGAATSGSPPVGHLEVATGPTD